MGRARQSSEGCLAVQLVLGSVWNNLSAELFRVALVSVLWPLVQERFWQKAGGEGRLVLAALEKGLASVSAILVSADLRIPGSGSALLGCS